MSHRYYSTELLHLSLIPRLSRKPGNETDSTSLLTANPIDTAEYGNLQQEEFGKQVLLLTSLRLNAVYLQILTRSCNWLCSE